MRALSQIPSVLLLVLLSTRLEAQPVLTHVLDERVRVRIRGAETLVGRAVRVTLDSLTVEDEHTRRDQSVAMSDINRIDRWTGVSRGDAALRGTLIGGGLGVAVIIAGLAADARVDGETMGYSNVAIAAPAAVLVTLVGTGIGALVGGQRWKPLAPAYVGVRMQAGHSLAVGFRMSF